MFRNELEELRYLIDIRLEQVLNEDDSYKKDILEAIKYSLFTGGKRIRPILCLKSFDLFKPNNKNYDDVIDYALAVEMIHTYSLVHDDLPAMDDDDYRRGKLTSHKKFGEAMAILAGDGLLNLAFELILNTEIDNTDQSIRAMRELAKYSGISGMIGGQVIDLHLNKVDASEDDILYMYKNKTAALIQASVVMGAIIAGASEEEVESMREFGYNLGMSYQLQDDFLDLEEDRSIDKITYISIFGENRARNDLDAFMNRSVEILEALEKDNLDFFLQLLSELRIRKV